MTHARLLRFDLEDPVHGQVPCAALLHEQHRQRALPCCLFLYGGGGSRESLASMQASFEAAWSEGQLAPCIIATPDAGPWSFYLDDRARGYAWESFISERFVPHVRAWSSVKRLGIVGISMGGYGALKLAFGHPQLFAAVAAVSPMIEPLTAANSVPLRNRFFYPPEVPQALLGLQRDDILYQADHPTARVRALSDPKVEIYVDAADQDELNAHDGAECLHRVLWELDIPHEYHLRRDAHHAGPDSAPRVCEALRWVIDHLQPTAAKPLTEIEQAWLGWLTDPSTPQPTLPLAAESPLFPRFLRASLEPQRRAARLKDPSLSRHYGKL